MRINSQQTKTPCVTLHLNIPWTTRFAINSSCLAGSPKLSTKCSSRHLTSPCAWKTRTCTNTFDTVHKNINLDVSSSVISPTLGKISQDHQVQHWFFQDYPNYANLCRFFEIFQKIRQNSGWSGTMFFAKKLSPGQIFLFRTWSDIKSSWTALATSITYTRTNSRAQNPTLILPKRSRFCKFMKIYGNLWKFMKIYGNLRKFTEIYGNLRMVRHRFFSKKMVPGTKKYCSGSDCSLKNCSQVWTFQNFLSPGQICLFPTWSDMKSDWMALATSITYTRTNSRAQNPTLILPRRSRLCKFMKIYGNLWKFMKIYGNLRKFTEIYGNLRMVRHRFFSKKNGSRNQKILFRIWLFPKKLFPSMNIPKIFVPGTNLFVPHLVWHEKWLNCIGNVNHIYKSYLKSTKSNPDFTKRARMLQIYANLWKFTKIYGWSGTGFFK